VHGSDGQDRVLAVAKDTRIIFTNVPDTCQPISGLTVGSTISCTFDAGEPGTLGTARLVVRGSSLHDYLICASSNERRIRCPVLVSAITPTLLTGSLVPRDKASMQGLQFWEHAGPGAAGLRWEATIVKNWIDHPAQTLSFGLDRATEVICNGMRAQRADIRVGDQASVEIRPDQAQDHQRPLVIFIYRFGNQEPARH